jgi:hypothetical protein
MGTLGGEDVAVFGCCCLIVHTGYRSRLA